MNIVLVTTSLLLIFFQIATHTTTATTTNTSTTGQLLDESILKLQQNVQRLTASTHDLVDEYKALKNDIAAMRKLHRPCDPCKASTETTGVCDCTNIKPKKDCLQFYLDGYKVNGVYRLQKGPGFHTLHAYCDQTTEGGGWTVFQRRQDGSVEFNRTWSDYKDGFGDIEGEFWFGNENIYDLTKPSFAPKKSQLLINMRMKDAKDSTVFVKYNRFEIMDEALKYKLAISGFTGNVTVNPKGLDYNSYMKFSTFDSDNDRFDKGHCGKSNGAGWWYGFCTYVNLNAAYKFVSVSSRSITWHTKQPIFVEMKTRRIL